MASKKTKAKKAISKKKVVAKKKSAVAKTAKKVKNPYQTGERQTLYGEMMDRMIKAKRPGKRQSESGKVYYERRRNRSDMPGTLAGIEKTEKHYKKMLTGLLMKKITERELATKKSEKAKLQKEISALKKKIKAI